MTPKTTNITSATPSPLAVRDASSPGDGSPTGALFNLATRGRSVLATMIAAFGPNALTGTLRERARS